MCVKEWHVVCFTENNNGGSKRAYKNEHASAINIFHDIDSTLYTVTNIRHKARLEFC